MPTVVAYVLAAVVLVLLAGLAYQAWGSARDARRFPAPGRMVDIGGCRLHVHEMGTGEPVVVLEAGLVASSLSWRHIQPAVAEFARTVIYDRAALGWSEPSTGARNADRIIAELHAMLSAARIAPPYVLVGHSFGGMTMRLYAARYPSEVAGMVLVDALHPNEWRAPTDEQRQRLMHGAALARRGALLARLGVVRAALALLIAGAQRLPRMVARASSGGGLQVTERLVGEVRKLPPEVWPLVAAQWCRPKGFRAMASYLESLAESVHQSIDAVAPAHIPLIVISAGNLTPERMQDQGDVARQSKRGKQIVAQKSGHWIHLDEPGVVIEAIREVVQAVRTRA